MANKELRCLRQDEIMVGNYITDEWAMPGKLWPVTGFNIKGVTYGNTSFICKWDNSSPVPITKEILQLFGFTRTVQSREGQYEQWGLNIKGFDFMFEFYNEGGAQFYLSMVGVDISFVHEFQNLYYSLFKVMLKLDSHENQSR